MAGLLRTTPVLQRRATYQACMFGAFSAFWTAAPLLLAGSVYRYGQTAIALFLLAGASEHSLHRRQGAWPTAASPVPPRAQRSRPSPCAVSFRPSRA